MVLKFKIGKSWKFSHKKMALMDSLQLYWKEYELSKK